MCAVGERAAWPGHCCAKSAEDTGQWCLGPLIWMFACSLWVCFAPGLGFTSANQPNVAACASEVISGDSKEWLISV